MVRLRTSLHEDKTKWRQKMEDFSFVNTFMVPRLGTVSIYGVCDGHGGYEASQFVSREMLNIMEVGMSLMTIEMFSDKGMMQKIMTNCFAYLENELENKYREHLDNFGTTCAMVIYSEKTNMWYAVNCGDSSVFGIIESNKDNKDNKDNNSNKDNNNEYRVLRITKLHKPDEQNEFKRITKAGGFVTSESETGVPRLQGNLAVSRSLGDYSLRKYGLTEKPEIYGPFSFAKANNSSVNHFARLNYNAVVPLEFIGFLICSDGITDFIEIKKMEQLLSKNFSKRYDFARILIENTDSQDNASVICSLCEFF